MAELSYQTAEKIDQALVAAPHTIENYEDYSSGVVAGIKMAIRAQSEDLTVEELFSALARLNDRWVHRPDFVIGALAGSLAGAGPKGENNV